MSLLFFLVLLLPILYLSISSFSSVTSSILSPSMLTSALSLPSRRSSFYLIFLDFLFASTSVGLSILFLFFICSSVATYTLVSVRTFFGTEDGLGTWK